MPEYRRTGAQVVDFGLGSGEAHLHSRLLRLREHIGRTHAKVVTGLGIEIGDGLPAIGKNHADLAARPAEWTDLGAGALHLQIHSHFVG